MATEKAYQLKLMQFNVENLFFYLDPHVPLTANIQGMAAEEFLSLSSATVRNKPLASLKAVARTIDYEQADIVMLNEVGGLESLQNFCTYFLKTAYVPYLIEGNSDRGIDVGYLVHPRVVARPLLLTHKERRIALMHPHDDSSKTYYMSRDIAELRLFARERSTPSWVFLLTHLKSKLDPEMLDPDGRRRRRAEVQLLTDIYNETRRELGNEVPIVCAGDFNGNFANELEFISLKQTDLADVLELADLPLTERYTQSQFFDQQERRACLDYILLPQRLKPYLIPGGTYVAHFRDEYDSPLGFAPPPLRPSDHRPVVASLSGPNLAELFA